MVDLYGRWIPEPDYNTYPKEDWCDYDCMATWIREEGYEVETSLENLIDIMDDIEADWKAKQGIKKFIVPIKMLHTKGEIVREVIIETNKAETAMLIAIGDFQHNGWMVDTNFNNYKIME